MEVSSALTVPCECLHSEGYFLCAPYPSYLLKLMTNVFRVGCTSAARISVNQHLNMTEYNKNMHIVFYKK